MNIEKLAKHLKEFTLDEINMIAEENCKTELEHLLNEGKIVFENGMYKYIGKEEKTDFSIFIDKKYHKNQQNFEKAIIKFMKEYVKVYCRKQTVQTYQSLFKTNILPFFKNKNLKIITDSDITDFYNFCISRGLSPRRTKNTLALLKQLLMYCKNRGWIKTCCDFQVKRLTSKNEFSMNRIIFEGD